MVSRFGYPKYANIYCEICNGDNHDAEELCITAKPDKGTTASVSLALAIDYHRVCALVDKRLRGSKRRNILNYVEGEDLTVEDTTLQETYETYILSTHPFLIKKTSNFCNRVRLTRSGG